VDLGNSNFAFLADNGMYVCADNGGATYLVANRTAVGPWETFSIQTINTFRSLGLSGIGSNFLAKKRTTSFGKRRGGGASLPAEFSWAGLSPIRDQGACGSCWAFAAVCAYESKAGMKGFGVSYFPAISVQQQVSCNIVNLDGTAINGCCGGPLNAIQYWETNHPMLNTPVPYRENATECTVMNPDRGSTCAEIGGNQILSMPLTRGYYTLNWGANIDQVKESIYWDGPAIVAMSCYDDDFNNDNGYTFSNFWYGPKNTVYTETGIRYIGGHAISIIGWSTSRNAWLCQNSWGAGGPNNNGTFYIAFAGHQHANDINYPTLVGLANESVLKGNTYLACTGNAIQIYDFINGGDVIRPVPGTATVLSGDPRNRIWIIDASQRVWQKLPETWVAVPGIAAKDITHSTNGTGMYVYATSTSNQLYALNSAGTGWTLVSTPSISPASVDVDCNGVIYIVTTANQVYRKTQTATTWTLLSGIAAVDIGVDPGAIYACDVSGYLYNYNESTSKWVLVSGISGVKKVDVGPGESVAEIVALLSNGNFMINSNNVWRTPSGQSGNGFVKNVGSCSWR
jgi:hypothetical protein